MICEMCDGYIVSSKKLRDWIVKDYGKPTWVFHNYLNLEQEAVSKDVVDIKKYLFK